MNIHCKIDDFFVILMKKLEIEIPVFKLERWAQAEIEVTKSGKEILNISGVTECGGAYDLFKSVQINEKSGFSKALTEDQMQDDSEFKVRLNW